MTRQSVNVLRQQGGKVVKHGRPTCEAECRSAMAVQMWIAADKRRLAAAANTHHRRNYLAAARHAISLASLYRRGLADHLALVGHHVNTLP